MAITRNTAIADFYMPIAVLAVVGMIIFPLPLAVLDLLLVFNLSFAICLILVTVYLIEAEKFTSLPTIILISTVFRLGLNIATTRQLLSYGEAPETITAFGELIVNGNIVVGLIIFFILAIIQFVVIAKGAERVAEVTARFTLDALPGKQMSIDADLRSGIMGIHEAKEKRLELIRESKLFGSMDGCMKFVKGDAIAGFIIIFINIFGGLIIGTLQLKLSLSEAFQKFTVFTIGDAIASQVPALLIATAASIAITRVNQKSINPGREMMEHLCQEPKALIWAGCVNFVIAFLPGIPSLPFIFAGIFLIFTSQISKKEKNLIREKEQTVRFSPHVRNGLVLEVSSEVYDLLSRQTDSSTNLQNIFNKIKKVSFQKWGLLLPEIFLEILQEEDIRDNCNFRIVFQGIVRFEEELKGNLFAEIEDYLDGFIESILPELVDDTQIRKLLEIHSEYSEDKINSVIPEVLTINEVTIIVRHLLREKISVSNLDLILQTIAECKTQQGSTTESAIAENLPALVRGNVSLTSKLHNFYVYIRKGLKQQISANLKTTFLKNQKCLFYLIKPEDEVFILNILLQPNLLTMEFINQLRDAVYNLQNQHQQDIVVISSSKTRSFIASFFFTEDGLKENKTSNNNLKDSLSLNFYAIEELTILKELKCNLLEFNFSSFEQEVPQSDSPSNNNFENLFYAA